MIAEEKLKKLRLMRNLTQKELAIKSSLTDAAIRNYELGNRSPSKEQLQKKSKALNCDISALIDHEPNFYF
ncbi:MAG: helix-turn-helix domain-containing protein [Facklamia hominis]